MKKKTHILLQTLIFLLPAVLATNLEQVNDAIPSPLEEFTWYRCGLSGIFFMAGFDQLLHNATLAAGLTSTLYLLVLLVLANRLYRNENKRILKFSIWNLLIGLWGIASGTFWMVSAMQ